MYQRKRDVNTYPPAKPNGDTNRSQTDIEIALAREFGFERNIIAFNVQGISWILPLFHECDMVVVSMKSHLLTEIEIKRSWTDFCADFKKEHHHENHGAIETSSFWYAIPEGFYEKAIAKLNEELIIPTGIITYDEDLVMKHHTCIRSHCPENEGKWGRVSTYSYDGHNSLTCEEVEKGVKSGRYFKIDVVSKEKKPIRLYSHNAHPLFTEQLLEIARLGCMRQVSLRERISKLEKD